MCLAAQGGTFEHVRCLDSLCVAGAGVDCKTQSGLTPLQVAVMSGQLNTTRELILRGANKQILDRHDRNLLHLAAEGGKVEVLEYLIDEANLSVHAKDKEGLTPLHQAAHASHSEAVLTLLRKGADPQAKDHQGETALHWGIKHEAIAKRLIKFFVEPGPRAINLIGHHDSVNSVAFSPNGGTMASGSNYYTTKLWNVYTGAVIRSLSGHENTAYSISLSPDGSMLASGSYDNHIKLWNADTGATICSLYGHTSQVRSAAFSPDGSMLASGSNDKTVKLWKADTHTLIHTLEGHAHNVLSVAFSPDGSMLASGSDDNTIKLWNAQTGALLHTLEGHRGGVGTVAFSSDSCILASAAPNCTIKLWNAQTGAFLRNLKGRGYFVNSVAFSPDGPLLASGSNDNNIELWNAETGALLSILKGHSSYVFAVAFSPDGQTIASGSNDHTIKLWSLRWGSLLHHAIRGGNLKVIKMVVQRFPLLLYIRTPQGQLPLELAEELLVRQENDNPTELPLVVDFLRRQITGV